MDAITVLVIVGLIHCFLFFLDTIFRSCSHYPYLYFLKNTGWEIKVFRVEWYTTVFNRAIVRWGMDRSKFWLAWFNAGALITICLLPFVSFYMMKNAYQLFAGSSQSKEDTFYLEPVMPGVNLPFNEIGYYVLSLAVCSIFHEFGHALAAAREDVQLFGVGFLIVFIVPIAYVQMSSEQLSSLPLFNQLRILCAGIWHNIILAVMAVAFLLLTTWLWAPLYTTGHGLYIKTIDHNSPVLGPSGLLQYDTIYGLNDCPTNDENSWYNCIVHAMNHPTPGYCVLQSLIQSHDETVSEKHIPNGAVKCCAEDNESSGNLCFEYVEGPQTAPLQLPPYSCLPARIIAEKSQNFCQSHSQCSSHDTFCMRPALDNMTKIIQIKRAKWKDVLFFGHPSDIYRTVEVSGWVPKYSFLNPEVPEALALLCKYIAIFSSGLAVINVVPCFFFDGQYIINTLAQFLLRPRVRHKSLRQAIALTITAIGTFFLLINLIYSIFK